MTSIIRATTSNSELLADIGRLTFIESHGKSASESDIDFYISEKFTYEVFQEELSDAGNIYHILYNQGQPIGYSKIEFNCQTPNIQPKNVTKLGRLYLLKEFYELKLGLELFNFNIELSKNNNQAGIWLFVWKQNERAVNFYRKNGFETIGSYNFEISATHSNPNHQMFLKY